MSQPKTKISIVIPTLNEASNIDALVDRLVKSLKNCTVAYELIFVDDGSTDGTPQAIRHRMRELPIKFATKKGRSGKSFSILQGAALASYDTLAMIDADLQYPPEALPSMIRRLETGADLVMVRRDMGNLLPIRKIGSRVIVGWFKLLFGLSADIQSGQKLFKKGLIKAVDPAHVGPWTLDMELVCRAMTENLRIESVNISFGERVYGKSKVHVISDGLAIMAHALQIRLRRHRRWQRRYRLSHARASVMGVVGLLVYWLQMPKR